MPCKPILCTYTSAAQTITGTGVLSFDTNKILSGIGFSHAAGSSTITIARAGIYFISFDADVEQTSTTNIIIDLLNNNTPVIDATAEISAAEGNVIHVHFDTLVKVLPSCCAINNVNNLQIVVNGASSITNAKITIF